MDKLYGDYDKVFEKYKKNNLHKRKNEKNVGCSNKKEPREKAAPEKKKEKDLNKMEETNKREEANKREKAVNKREKAVNKKEREKKLRKESYLSSEDSHNKVKYSDDTCDENEEFTAKIKKRDCHYSYNDSSCTGGNNNSGIPGSNMRDRSFNEYKIRKKVSIEINKKIYSDSENLHINDRPFTGNFGINENNYISKKKKNKNEDYRIKKMQNKKDKTKFFVNFLFPHY
ncbi:conserved Plasmodium protein, unknown function [Plasmodium ovale curtisi]|uniref:Uncharacterized protein n=1 Tax=Plasmodium ovale curtisi TaxID=864141 RepID=A0A1A8W4A9_PLAOA|nr:conserved Plasmodium protein, unknown function [Plasmodium ovale curtisi]SBS96277.1 conserved Plasmodium protein, unknown function [Plasmodium ovale curtisi]